MKKNVKIKTQNERLYGTFFIIHLFIVDENTIPNINLQLK